MSPALFISMPFVLLLLMSRRPSDQSTETISTKPSIEKVIDLLGNQDDEIIIVCKKKR